MKNEHVVNLIDMFYVAICLFFLSFFIYIGWNGSVAQVLHIPAVSYKNALSFTTLLYFIRMTLTFEVQK